MALNIALTIFMTAVKRGKGRVRKKSGGVHVEVYVHPAMSSPTLVLVKSINKLSKSKNENHVFISFYFKKKKY